VYFRFFSHESADMFLAQLGRGYVNWVNEFECGNMDREENALLNVL